MDYRIITTKDEFAAIKTDWERLEKTDSKIIFFSTYEYCSTWWEVFHDHPDYDLLIICVYQNEDIVGIAPLMLKQERKRYISYVSLMFLGEGDYKDILINKNHEIKPENIFKEIFKAIFENDHLWDEMRLTHISQKSPLALYLLKSDYNPYFKYLIENPYVNLSDFKDFNDFSLKQLPKKTRQYASRLKKETNYSFHTSKDNFIEEFSAIHIAEKNHLHSLGNIHRSSFFENSFRRKFIDNLFSKKDISSFYLYDNILEQIMIFNYGFSYNNVFNSVTTAFNPAYSQFGVGKIIYFEIFKDQFLNPTWALFDTGTGRYPWKFEWATGFNFLYYLHYVNPRNKKLKLLYKYKAAKKIF